MEKVFTFLAVVSLSTLVGRYFGYAEETLIGLAVLTGTMLLYSMLTAVPQIAKDNAQAIKRFAGYIGMALSSTGSLAKLAVKFSYKGIVAALEVYGHAILNTFSAVMSVPRRIRAKIFAENSRRSAVKFLMAKNANLKFEIESLKSEIKELDNQLKDIVSVWKPASQHKPTNDYFVSTKTSSLSELSFEETAGKNAELEVTNETFVAQV